MAALSLGLLTGVAVHVGSAGLAAGSVLELPSSFPFSDSGVLSSVCIKPQENQFSLHNLQSPWRFRK